jgi:hypothetical protein
MDSSQKSKLKSRVWTAAEAILSARQRVSLIDVLEGIQLLSPNAVAAWRRGRTGYLEPEIQGSREKVRDAIAMFLEWGRSHELPAREAVYQRQTRNGPVNLQFTESGDPGNERIFRTEFWSSQLSAGERESLERKAHKEPDAVVFRILRDSRCMECGVELGNGSLLLMDAGQPLCLACAGMDELEFLPAGDAALTRRSAKYSKRKAVVVQFSRSRGRYERQGILVEPAAAAKAERECSADADQRASQRARDEERRRKEDALLAQRIAQRIRELFPGCPPGEAAMIAKHTAARGSGRAGRSAAGKRLEDAPLEAAVRAAVRHRHTRYDQLLLGGMDRTEARTRVAVQVEEVLSRWRAN